MHKYDEIMDKVCMTENMKERILKNSREVKKGASAGMIEKKKRERLVSVFCLIAAACITFIALYQISPLRISDRALQSQTADQQDSDELQAIWDVTECSSIQELSNKVGFTVSEIDTETLPFTVKKVSYLAYPDKLAEISYLGSDEEKVCYREEIGSEDVSGDYNTYQQIETIKMQDVEITLKGEPGTYKTALWQKEGHSYSLSISQGADKHTWTKILMSVQ